MSDHVAASERPGAAAGTVVVHPDAETLAEAVAARLALALLDAQATRGSATVVLTGGTIAEKLYRSLRESPLRDVVDWSAVDVWWGDERFLPAGHPDRNETQARAALLDALPLTPARVFAMPASDGPDGDDAEAAAARYASSLAAAGVAGGRGSEPARGFDVLLLGIGEDGHVASIFPGHPVVRETLAVSAVHGSPKPPPTRITLTLPLINTAREVWLVAAGDGKADAVARALATEPTGPVPGSGRPPPVPAAAVRGVEHTRWLLDRTAAARLPRLG